MKVLGSFKQVSTTHISLRYAVFLGWVDGWMDLNKYVRDMS